jgi:hypothetical protein
MQRWSSFSSSPPELGTQCSWSDVTICYELLGYSRRVNSNLYLLIWIFTYCWFGSWVFNIWDGWSWESSWAQFEMFARLLPPPPYCICIPDVPITTSTPYSDVPKYNSGRTGTYEMILKGRMVFSWSQNQFNLWQWNHFIGSITSRVILNTWVHFSCIHHTQIWPSTALEVLDPMAWFQRWRWFFHNQI